MPNYVLVDGMFTPTTYTVSEIDTMFTVMGVSRYGDASDDSIPFSVEGNTVLIGTFGATVPAIFNGKRYDITSTQIAFPNADTTYNLYLTVDDAGNPGYTISTSDTPLTESITTMYIGQVTTDSDGLVTSGNVTLEKVTRLGIYRISPTRRGSAIPVYTGDPLTTGNFDWS